MWLLLIQMNRLAYECPLKHVHLCFSQVLDVNAALERDKSFLQEKNHSITAALNIVETWCPLKVNKQRIVKQ